MATPTQACNRCHKLHVKCGGGVPCDRCTKKGYDCVLLEHKKKRAPKDTSAQDLSLKRQTRKSNLSKVMLCACGFVFEHELICTRCDSPVSAANSVDNIVDQLKKLKHAGVTSQVSWAAAPPLWCVLRTSPSQSGADYWRSMKIVSGSAELKSFLGVKSTAGINLVDFLDPSVLHVDMPTVHKKDLILPFMKKRRFVSSCRCVFTMSEDPDGLTAVEVLQFLAIDLTTSSTSARVAGVLYDENDNVLSYVPSREVVANLPFVPSSTPQPKASPFAFPVAPPPTVAQSLAQANFPSIAYPWNRETLYGFDSFDTVTRPSDDKNLLNDWPVVVPSFEEPIDADFRPCSVEDNFEAELENLRQVEVFYTPPQRTTPQLV